VTGLTFSYNFPTTTGAYDTSYNRVGDIFVSKFDSSLTNLLASTYFGGKDVDSAFAISLDSSGNVYVAGYTNSSDFPTTPGAYDTSYGSSWHPEGFVIKFDNSLTSLLGSTYLGGDYNSDMVYAMSVDGSGNVYVAGLTYTIWSSVFPTTTGAYDTSFNGARDGFVSKLNNSLTSLLASTFLGGSSNDYVRALSIDGSGNIYVVGQTSSSDFPVTTGAYDTSVNGDNMFVSKLDSSLTSLISSTYLGGSRYDYARALSIDSLGNIYVAGETSSSDFPTTTGAYDTSLDGMYDGFVSKLNNSLTSLLASTFLGGSRYDYVRALSIDGSGNIYVAGCTTSSDFPTTSDADDILLVHCV
jgi:hypothetical protein